MVLVFVRSSCAHTHFTTTTNDDSSNHGARTTRGTHTEKPIKLLVCIKQKGDFAQWQDFSLRFRMKLEG